MIFLNAEWHEFNEFNEFNEDNIKTAILRCFSGMKKIEDNMKKMNIFMKKYKSGIIFIFFIFLHEFKNLPIYSQNINITSILFK